MVHIIYVIALQAVEHVILHLDILVKNLLVFVIGLVLLYALMENVKKVLADLKAPTDRTHIEYFSAVKEAVAAAEKTSAVVGGKVQSVVTVILDGEHREFDLASDGLTILDTACEADMDVPFACKGAVCCTCKAKVLEGKVTMTMNYALSEEEVAAGYVLTCQAHPASEKVVVSYDEP